jgi:group I intron endonuclease
MQIAVSYIYKITNVINSKVYIGQAKIPKNRKYQHWKEGHKPNSKNHLYRSMSTYGVENFKFEIIEECNIDNVDDRERYWISYYESCDPDIGYNRETGGKRGKMKVFSEEEKKRIYQDPKRSEAIRQSLLGRPLSEDHKRAVSEGVSRYFETHEVKHSEEAKRNMAAAQKIVGAKKTAKYAVDPSHSDAQPKKCPYCEAFFFPKKMTPWGIRRHVAKKFCSKKCIMLNNNKNISNETREKIANSKRGQKMPEEQKRKISESMKLYRKTKSKREN